MTEITYGRIFNKTGVVIGGSGGIGHAIVRRFVEEGACVAIADLAEPPPGLIGERVIFRPTDVTRAADVEHLVAETVAQFGRLDFLVNCAGIEIEKTILETSEEEWDRTMAVNTKSVFLTCKAAIPQLANSGGGAIVNFASMASYVADPGIAAYCASKGAVEALSRAIAVDHGKVGVRCNAICPGYVDTPMLNQFLEGSGGTKQMREKLEKGHPLGRIGTPDDIANLVLWLVSDEGAFASGHRWCIDGALTAMPPQIL